MTDPIADMLTRIRNASAVNKLEVIIPYSKIKLAITEILKKRNYILDFAKTDDNFGEIKIKLKYNDDKSAITSLKKISKPGRRVYAPKDEIPVVLNSYGIAIISTSKGLLTNREAKEQGVGGEILCEIY